MELHNGLKAAIEVVMNLAQTCNQVWNELEELAKVGNSATLSDLQVFANLYYQLVFKQG